MSFLEKLYAYPAAILVLVAMVMVAGVVTFLDLPIALYPDTSRPSLFVNLSSLGYDAEDFKERYGKDIEAKLMAIKEVEEVKGTYERESSHWQVIFAWNSDSDKAQNDVKAALSSLEAQFPREWNGFSYYFASSNSARIFMTVSSSRYSQEELWQILQNRLKSQLEGIAGIEHAFIVKPFEEYIRLDLQYDKLLTYGFSVRQVIDAIKGISSNQGLGFLKTKEGDQLAVTIPLKPKTLAQLQQTAVGQYEGETLYLQDLAHISLAPITPQELFKGNGKRALILGAGIKPDGNIAQACNQFEALVRQEAKAADANMQVEVLVNPSQYIQEAIDNVGEAVLSGIAITTLVIFLFLASFRLTIVIAIAIPLALIGGFIAMKLIGIELNLISLGAMALSSGMVVDGSIVVLENIVRHLEQQKPVNRWQRLQTIYQAVVEVRGAVLASLLTTIVVFAPLAYTAPLTNAILGDLAKVMVCVLVISIGVTLLVVPPLMQMWTEKRQEAKKEGIYRLAFAFQRAVNACERTYLNTLRFLMSKKTYAAIFLMTIFIFLGLSYIILERFIKKEILAVPDTDKVWLIANFPNQRYEIEDSDRLISPYEQILTKEFASDIHHFLTIVNKNGAYILCNLHDKRNVKIFKEKLEHRFQNTADMHFFVEPWHPTALEIPEPPLIRLFVHGESLEEKMKILSVIEETAIQNQDVGRVIMSPNPNKEKEYEIKFHQDLIQFLQRHEGDSLLQTELSHLVSYALDEREVQTLNWGQYLEPLKLKVGLKGLDLKRPEDIQNILIKFSGEFLPLRHFLSVTPNEYWQQWYTEKGLDKFKAEIYLKSSAKDKVASKDNIVSSLLKHPEIDASRLYFSDTDVEINKNILSLVYALLLSLALVWLVVSFQFGSLKQTAVVMAAIPLGFIGVACALFIFQSTLSINSMLGMVLLSGTAVNNSILYVDFYNSLDTRRSSRHANLEALLQTASLRFRPILITTATTIVGMFPIALGWGSGGEILQPLGIAVCGGLSISTLLTLVVVPLLLFFLDNKEMQDPGRGAGKQLLFVVFTTLTFLQAQAKMAHAQVASSEERLEISLPQAEDLALQHSYILKAQTHAGLSQVYKERGFYGSLLPQVSLEQTFVASQLQGGVRQQTLLQIQEVLPNPITLPLKLKNLAVEEKLRELERLHNRHQIIADFRKIYLKLLWLYHRFDDHQEKLVLLNKLKQDNERRFEKGFIPKVDVLRSKMYYQTAVAKLHSLAQDLNSEKAKLLQYMGKDQSRLQLEFKEKLVLKMQPRLMQWEEKQLQDLLLNHQAIGTQIKNGEYEQKALHMQEALWHWLPELTVGASLPLYETANDHPQVSYHAGLSWKLFAGGRDYYDYRQKVEAASEAEYGLKQQQLSNALRQKDMITQLINLRHELVAQEQTLASWEEIVSLAQNRFASGLINYHDLSEDISTYLSEKDKLVELTYQIVVLFIEFSQELGDSDILYQFFSH